MQSAKGVILLKALHFWTRSIAWTFIVLAVFSGAIYYLHPSIFGGHIRQTSNLYGALAIVAGCCAVGIWIVRKIYVQVKRRQIPDFDVTKAVLMFLRKHHILLGWLTVLLSTAHGVYYLLQYPNKSGEITTGLIAWSALLLLAAIGVVLDYNIASKKKAKSVRLYHFAFAAVFLIAMILHV